MDILYLVIVDNEVVHTTPNHTIAQDTARLYSMGRHGTAKVVLYHTWKVQGHWVFGERHA